MDWALRPIANVRGGDGVAALATGRVATVTDAKSLRPRYIQIAAVPFAMAKIRGGGWQSGDRSAGLGLDESGFR